MNHYSFQSIHQAKINDLNAEVARWKLAHEANPTQPRSTKQVIEVVMAVLMTVLAGIVRK